MKSRCTFCCTSRQDSTTIGGRSERVPRSALRHGGSAEAPHAMTAVSAANRAGSLNVTVPGKADEVFMIRSNTVDVLDTFHRFSIQCSCRFVRPAHMQLFAAQDAARASLKGSVSEALKPKWDRRRQPSAWWNFPDIAPTVSDMESISSKYESMP